MKTVCSYCSGNVDDDEVQMCATCDRDGLCPECLESHECDPEDAGRRSVVEKPVTEERAASGEKPVTEERAASCENPPLR
jgi:hypothetical protein